MAAVNAYVGAFYLLMYLGWARACLESTSSLRSSASVPTMSYSMRSARLGSTAAARTAGIRLASMATATSEAATAM